MEFLFLNEQDMVKAEALNMDKCLEKVEEAFSLLGKGDYLMGGPDGNSHGLMLWFPKESPHPNMPLAGPDRRFMSLIAYLGGDFNVCCNKWYGSNIENRNKNLPRSIHTITLNDPVTGAPIAVMPGNIISAMRTGAVPGVATKYLANPEAKVLGAIGAGLINQSCIRAIVKAKPDIERVKIYDIDIEKGREISKKLEEKLGVNVEAVHSMKDSVENCDIITVATSGYQKPRIESEWIKKGCLVTITGAVELSDDVYKHSKIVADHWDMHKLWLKEGLEHEDGLDSIDWTMSAQLLELVHYNKIDESKIESMGNVVANKEKIRESNDDIVIFMTGGLPIEDAAWGYEVYRTAKEKGLGQKIKMWDEPQLV